MINFQELEKVAEFKNGELNWLEGRDINAVYVILVEDEYYIGSSHYTYLRIGQHLDKLLKGEHHSCKLQEKFNAVGEFEVYSLDRGIEKSKLQLVEAKYIQRYKPTLNIASTKEKSKIGTRIKELIKEKGYTQEQFAKKMGVTRMAISGLIAGNPTMTTLEKIAKALDIGIWEFFKSKEEFIKEIEEQKKNTVPCPYCGRDINLSLLKKEE